MMESNHKFHVDVINTGSASVPAPEVYWMEGWDKWEDLSFHSLLLRGNGMNIIINTGLPEDLQLRNKAMLDFAGERCKFKRNDLKKELRELGVSPDEIDVVFFTPIQDYTTGGINLFKNAKIYLNRRGWNEDISSPKFKNHLPRELFIPGDQYRYLLFEAWERVVFFDSLPLYEIIPGLKVRWVGCHHRSSLAFEIETESGKAVFSDCFFKKRNIENSLPIGIAESTLECLDAYSIYGTNYILLPAYDPEIDGRKL